MRIKKWVKQNTESLEGKLVAVSGATGGIGRELCDLLASLGASLVLLDRNMTKSLALAEELRGRYPDLTISHISVDLEKMDMVKEAAEQLKALPLDFLILNAGAYSIPRHTCETGYDNVFQINFVSPYYLARTLLPSLRTRGGKVIAVSSIAHNYSKADFRDVDFATRKKASLVYGNAKRFLTYSLFALGESHREIAIVHPGITFTNITAHYPKLIFGLIKHPMKVIFMKPRKAVLSILKGMFENCGKNEWIGPRFFNVWGTPKKKPLRTATPEEARAIAQIAERMDEKEGIETT